MPLENQPMGILSAADRLLIEEEHTRLERMLNDLCDTCSNFATLTDCRHCSKEKIASCQGRLPSFFFDFQDFVAEHFENEESIMDRMIRPSDINEYLRKHQQEHATLMLSVKRLVQEASELSHQGNVAIAIRQFHRLIKEKFSEHAHTCDSTLMQSSHG